MLSRYRSIKVKFIGPTNTRGARVALHDTWHGVRKYIPYDHRESDALAVAIKYLMSVGFSVDALTSDNHYWQNVILTKDFALKLPS